MAQTKDILRECKQVYSLMFSETGSFVRNRLYAVLAIVLFASILSALTPVAMKFIIDGFAAKISGAQIALLVVAYLLSQWLVRILGEVRNLIHYRAERRMSRVLSRHLFDHIMWLPMRFHSNRKTGAIVQTTANGVQGCQIILQQIVTTLLPILVEIGTVALILIHLNKPIYLGLFICSFAIYGSIFGFGMVRIAGPARAASSAQVSANAVMTDSILNYETVKYFSAETTVRDKYDQSLAETEKEWIGYFRIRTASNIAATSVFAVFLAATILYAARQVSQGTMSIGEFVLVNTYMTQIIRPAEMMGMAMQQFSQGISMLEKMLELFREIPEPSTGARQLPVVLHGALQFEDVTFSYSPKTPVLKGVSFSVKAGQTVAIVGESGAGKSTLARLLLQFIRPTSGRILVDGVPITEVAPAKIRSAIAVVPQDTPLFHDTIEANISVGKPGSSREEIEAAAKLAHLHEFVAGLPDAYATVVGERGVRLSGGERQRVAIARALLKHAPITLCDEATSSLDPDTEYKILPALISLAHRQTTLFITHRLSIAVHADQILVLQDGVIAEQGNHESLLRLNGRYAALWRTQQLSGHESGEAHMEAASTA